MLLALIRPAGTWTVSPETVTVPDPVNSMGRSVAIRMMSLTSVVTGPAWADPARLATAATRAS